MKLKKDTLIIDPKADKELINQLIRNYIIKKLKKAKLKTLRPKQLHLVQSFRPVK